MVIELLVQFIIYFVTIPLIVIFISFKVFNSDDELLSLLVSVTVSMLVFVVFNYSTLSLEEYKPYDTRSLVALQDSETLVVSRYSSDSEIYYYYMQQIGNTYHPEKASQSKSVIRYTSDSPVVKVYKKEIPNKFIEFLTFGESHEYKYEFYLPKGSIEEDFNVDLK